MDRKQSPLGYEQYDEITVTRQVVIGGKNKYLINGSNANNTRVQDLFRSVQLNVNNPHFLIMQGRITKVLNMKPPEILSMIEEAAGTRLYESKKESAQRTIEKKDAKLKEIDTILREEIAPTLTKLKEERSSYLEYQKILREIDHLNKLHVAYQFVCAEETKQKSAGDLVTMRGNIKTLEKTKIENDKRIEDITKIIDEMEHKRDVEAGGAMENLEVLLKERQTADAKAQSNLEHKSNAIKGEQKKKKELKKQKDDDKKALEKQQKEQEKHRANFEKLQNESQQDQESYTAAQKHFHAVSSGLSSNADGEDATLNGQLIGAKQAISTAETATKQAQMKLKHNEKEIKKKQGELKKTEQGYKKDQQAHEAIKATIQKLEAELQKLNFEEGKEKTLSEQRRALTREVQMLRERRDTMEARFPQLQFSYKDPEKNFDRRKVQGLVARLIKMKKSEAATAIEVAAGGRLYQLVVSDEVTSKKLINHGELKRRYTIIPLNKIYARSIDTQVVKRAENLVGPDNVQTALSLVGYDKELQKAMEFVFGSHFVCPTMEIGKKVAFEEGIKKKTVTLSGEVFDPAGTLTGGSRPQAANSVLNQLDGLREVETSLNEKQSQLQQVERELESISRMAEKYNQVKGQFDLKVHEASLVDERLKQSTHHQQLEEINELQKSLDEQEVILKEAEDTLKKEAERVKDLEYKVKNAKALREQELKNAELEMNKAKKKAEESKKKMKEKEQVFDTLKLEAEELNKEIKNCEEQFNAINEAIAGYEEQCTELAQIAAETKEAVKLAHAELNDQKELIKTQNREINEKAGEVKKMMKANHNNLMQIEELKSKVSKFEKESSDAEKQVNILVQKYPWIFDEKKYFGQANTAYDFKVNNPKEAAQRLNKLVDSREKLSRSVNMRAMNMLGKAEEQYNDLMKKRAIVLNDKSKIAKVITEMDKKKNEALQKAYEQVNKDFGSIFSTLLPGTNAKLTPPEGQSVLSGLEVKVAFGDVWKESLGELSGGQRSLVALSLILSLLLFKPAPLYILDEVDAALDLSHTQNIGQMLRTHFRHSQFIVVSLKDGMFNNANVLFKTKFVDGVSTVTRYVQNQASRGQSTSTSINKENRTKGGKATSKRPRMGEGGDSLSSLTS
ncbi:structural maintenance of chromosomes protein 2-like isoform X2 [Lineus longissimus]